MGEKSLTREHKEPKRGNLDDLDWLRLLIGIGPRRMERRLSASFKITTGVRLTQAEKIDALILIAAKGVQAAERIATCMERRARIRPRKKRKASR
jgi:hypothetical protein